MTGKSTLGQHLVAAKFASLKGFLISSDEDDYSDEELDTSAHQKQKHFWLDDDDDEEGEEEEEDEEREELGKAVKAYAVSKRSSSGRKRLRNQHRRRPEQSSSPLPSPPRQIRSSKSKAKDPHKKVPSRELTISSDGEEEAFNINTEGEDEGEEQTKKANKCQKSPVRQDSKVIRSKYIRSADDQQMTTRPTTRKAEAARKGGETACTSEVVADNCNPDDVQEICANLKKWTKSIVPHFKPSEKETSDILSGNFSF